MSDNFPERLNLPLSPSMLESIKQRAAQDGMSAVAFIRRCVQREIEKTPKIDTLEERIEALEHIIRESVHHDDYRVRGKTTHKSKGSRHG